jgi:hypothetical protein
MEVSGQLHVPAAFSLGKEFLCTHWIGGQVGSRDDLGTVAKRIDPFIIPAGN